MYKIRKSTNNWSSNFDLIEEIMGLSRILLAVLSAGRKKRSKSTGLYCFIAKEADWKGSFWRSLSLSWSKARYFYLFFFQMPVQQCNKKIQTLIFSKFQSIWTYFQSWQIWVSKNSIFKAFFQCTALQVAATVESRVLTCVTN